LGQFVRQNDTWAGNNFVYGYVRLKDGANPRALEAKLPAFLQRHGAEQLKQSGMKKQMNLQPITAIHTTPGLSGDTTSGVGLRFLNILLFIAGFIQLIACINFMNLSTARATRRAQEVGVRKAIGADRKALIGQFLSESMLLAGISIALAIPLLWLALPLLNQLTGAEVAFKLLQNPEMLALTGGLVLLTGMLAGSYPALYLSSFQPISALRGALNLKNTASAATLRKGLVVSQFVLAILLIVCALIVRLQLGYMLQKDLGFEAKQKIVLPFLTAESQQKLEILRSEFSRLPEVKAAAASAIVPGQMVFNDNFMYKNGEDMSKSIAVSYTYTDEHYLDALKIKLLAGRFFTPADTSSDQSKFKLVVNETTLKKLNIPLDQAPGMVLRSDLHDARLEMTIIGVMQDYHYGTLSREIKPYALSYAPSNQLAYVIADVETNNLPGFLKKAGGVWRNILPAMPFEYSFLDQDFAKLYQTEQTLAGIVGAFTLVAILISCLGLFGLAAFSAEQRRKEIGVRKVLGASVASVVGLLSADFLKLVLIAIVIASPIAWYFMDRWLADFAYRIDMQWWMFAVAGGAAVLIAFLTVGAQSVKAALANPVKSLRSE
jgi:putative ABC transport system permease protein